MDQRPVAIEVLAMTQDQGTHPSRTRHPLGLLDFCQDIGAVAELELGEQAIVLGARHTGELERLPQRGLDRR